MIYADQDITNYTLSNGKLCMLKLDQNVITFTICDSNDTAELSSFLSVIREIIRNISASHKMYILNHGHLKRRISEVTTNLYRHRVSFPICTPIQMHHMAPRRKGLYSKGSYFMCMLTDGLIVIWAHARDKVELATCLDTTEDTIISSSSDVYVLYRYKVDGDITCRFVSYGTGNVHLCDDAVQQIIGCFRNDIYRIVMSVLIDLPGRGHIIYVPLRYVITNLPDDNPLGEYNDNMGVLSLNLQASDGSLEHLRSRTQDYVVSYVISKLVGVLVTDEIPAMIAMDDITRYITAELYN